MERSAKWYDEAYRVSQEYRKAPGDSRYFPIWDKALSLIGDEKVIDLGCGSGQFAKLLLNNGKNFICGIDFSVEAIEIARQLNPGNKFQFFMRDLVADFQIPSVLYDLVTCFEVLEHITEDLDVIKKIDSGKRFIFSVPNYDYRSHVRKFNSEMQILRRYFDLVEIQHVYHFTIHDKNIIYLVDSVRK